MYHNRMKLLKKARLELVEGTSSKFYELELIHNEQNGDWSVWASYGKIGAKNITEEQKFSEYEEEASVAEFEKILKQKKAKGYQEVDVDQTDSSYDDLGNVLVPGKIGDFNLVALLKDYVKNNPKRAMRSIGQIYGTDDNGDEKLVKFSKFFSDLLNTDDSAFEVFDNDNGRPGPVEWMVTIPLEDDYNVADLEFLVVYDESLKQIIYQEFNWS